MSAETHSPGILRAIRAAFGERAEPHGLAPVGAGRSGAAVFSFSIDGRAYVVRAPDRSRVGHEERLARELRCVELAAERGIGPDVVWVDPATGITITVMIDDALVGPARALAPGRLERLAVTLRRLHDGPRIEGGGTVFDILRHFDELLVARRGRGVPPSLDRVLRESAEAASRFGLVATCHNDLNPSNILETPSRAYLVDWETAGDGDPFVDVAQVGVFGLLDDDRRAELLTRYLGHAPTERDRAHARLARVIALGFYAVSFTALAALTGEGDPEDATAPRTMREVLIGLAQGTAKSSEVAAHLQTEALRESASDGYAAALALALALATRG